MRENASTFELNSRSRQLHCCYELMQGKEAHRSICTPIIVNDCNDSLRCSLGTEQIWPCDCPRACKPDLPHLSSLPPSPLIQSLYFSLVPAASPQTRLPKTRRPLTPRRPTPQMRAASSCQANVTHVVHDVSRLASQTYTRNHMSLES